MRIVTDNNRCPVCLDDIEFGDECAIVCNFPDHKLHKICYSAMVCTAGTNIGDGSHVLPHEVRCPLCRGRREGDPLAALSSSAAPEASSSSSVLMSEDIVRASMIECSQCLRKK